MPELETIDEVDAALTRARAVPEDERTELWHVIVDALLEQRTALERADQRLEQIKAEREHVGR